MNFIFIAAILFVTELFVKKIYQTAVNVNIEHTYVYIVCIYAWIYVSI